jgi:hypothetical protein
MSQDHLQELRWHYGGAYRIDHVAPDVWVAQRTDDSTTLRAGTPGELLTLIRADYAENPSARVLAALRALRLPALDVGGPRAAGVALSP